MCLYYLKTILVKSRVFSHNSKIILLNLTWLASRIGNSVTQPWNRAGYAINRWLCLKPKAIRSTHLVGPWPAKPGWDSDLKLYIIRIIITSLNMNRSMNLKFFCYVHWFAGSTIDLAIEPLIYRPSVLFGSRSGSSLITLLKSIFELHWKSKNMVFNLQS